ncbi:MAG: glycerol-3-phosphate 1-O-acyltransferase PlsY [Johnsonella sp.]|nr:glycerol-3-phosphate 1-O-acyltransferase PlsY [Johnsonella sp.]
MLRIGLLFAGYLLGLIQSGYIMGRTRKMDIREHGSGNAGTTNALRVMGKKAGLIVFLGDYLKALIPCLIVRSLFGDAQFGLVFVYIFYTGLGVILGHNYPFYLGFKGGKGVASTAGVLSAIDPRLLLACALTFLCIAALTRFVSLASILMMLVFMGLCFFFSGRGDYGLGAGELMEFRILSAAIGLQSIYRHKENMKRLLRGSENKLDFSKK